MYHQIRSGVRYIVLLVCLGCNTDINKKVEQTSKEIPRSKMEVSLTRSEKAEARIQMIVVCYEPNNEEFARQKAYNIYREGLIYLEQKKYKEALSSFNSVIELLKWIPYKLDLENLRRKAQAKIEQAEKNI